MTKINYILLIIAILGIGTSIYLYNHKNNTDNTALINHINELNVINDKLHEDIKANEDTIDSIIKTNTVLDTKIKQKEKYLSDINTQTKFYEKQYKKELDNINDMSDSIIIQEFINTFSNR